METNNNPLGNILGSALNNVHLPEVPLKITIEDSSIIRIAITAIIVTTICLLIAKLLNK